MLVASSKERIILTEKEANTLRNAFDILNDIYSESSTDAGAHAEIAADAISDLISQGTYDDSQYSIGYEKQCQSQQKQMIFVALEI